MGLHRDGSKWDLNFDTVEARRYVAIHLGCLILQAGVLGGFQRRCFSGQLLLQTVCTPRCGRFVSS